MSIVILLMSSSFFYQSGGQQAALEKREVVVSYYSDWFQGREMAYGGKFNNNDPTIAANRSWPPDTEIEIENPKTGKWHRFIVRDWGPGNEHRDLDVSKAGAKRLGLIEKGVTKMKVRVIKAGTWPAGRK